MVLVDIVFVFRLRCLTWVLNLISVQWAEFIFASFFFLSSSSSLNSTISTSFRGTLIFPRKMPKWVKVATRTVCGASKLYVY